MTSRELTEWECYYALEPWGEERADWRAGNIASVVLNVNRTDKKQKIWTPQDFMLQTDTEREAPKPKPVSAKTQLMYHRFMLELNTARAQKQGQAQG